ncbi:MAG: hypothetical protein EXR98_16360 [Gemmataceae bacterium]|nr:hypothetical protein [Gemmataceae bacterium]
MLMRRIWMSVLTGLLVTSILHAQAVNLTEAPLPDRCFRNELSMQLEGKITVKQDGKDVAYPHKAQARHVFMERFLEASDGVGDKAARQYTSAESTITFNNNDSTKRSLRAERRFLVTQRISSHAVTFSPNGVMTREEMELTEHFDTMAVSGLVPGKTIDVGKSWKIADRAVAALCELDGLTMHNLEGKLEAVKGNLAQIKIVGNVQGINLGAQVAMIINAKADFDIKAQRIVALEWNETDARHQGPVTPSLSAEVTIKLTRTPIEEPEELNKIALVKVPTTKAPPAELTNIRHDDPKNGYTLHHARSWHVVSPEDGPQLVLRHLERGDFIAQATITSWKKADPKNVMAIGDFADLMAKTLGWAEDKEIERKEFKAEERAKGHHAVYRVVASGTLDGVATVQHFYLIVSPQGEQRIVTFSVVPQHVQRLGARDLELIRELAFP